MGLFVDPLKLTAAARSMPQFRPVVRAVFPGPAEAAVIEAATIYLYLAECRQIFGRAFAKDLGHFLLQNTQVGEAGAVDACLRCIAGRIEQVEESLGRFGTSKDQEFRDRVCGTIGAMLAEAGYASNDPQVVHDAFTPFENAVRRIRTHLTGIREQNHFVLK